MRGLVILLAAGACGCAPEPKAAADQPASAVPPPPATIDTVKSAPPADPSAAGAPLRDSAVGPRLEIGADGKIRPITKP